MLAVAVSAVRLGSPGLVRCIKGFVEWLSRCLNGACVGLVIVLSVVFHLLGVEVWIICCGFVGFPRKGFNCGCGVSMWMIF
jgi:hypothetical protein